MPWPACFLVQVDLAREATHLHAFNYNFRKTGAPRQQGVYSSCHLWCGEIMGEYCGMATRRLERRHCVHDADSSVSCPVPLYPPLGLSAQHSSPPVFRTPSFAPSPQAASPSRCPCTLWYRVGCWWRRLRQAHTSANTWPGEPVVLCLLHVVGVAWSGRTFVAYFRSLHPSHTSISRRPPQIPPPHAHAPTWCAAGAPAHPTTASWRGWGLARCCT